jgi:predicted TPR repeat methyltransferase
VTSVSLTIHEAIAHHQRGEVAKAESIYVELLKRNPNDADALHYLGVLRMAQGRRTDAVELVKQSVEVAPGNPHAWNSLGNMLMKCDEPKAAVVAYGKATAIQPDVAEFWFNLANLHRSMNQPDDAVNCYQRVVALKPKFPGAFESLALLLDKMGRHAERVDVLRQWREAEPANAVPEHMLAAVSGGPVPERASDQFVAQHFDQFAEHFDASLERLQYAAPVLISDALANAIPPNDRGSDVLDIGCGTGLLGRLLRPGARRLTGVDLSKRMLEKARARGVYDELHEGELVAYLRAHPASFDVVTCADTFVYFGALEEALGACAAALRPDGILAFTLEVAPAGSTEKFRLHGHGRYSHTESYVRACLASAGFATFQLERGVLRKEGGADVHGHVVLAKMGAAPIR